MDPKPGYRSTEFWISLVVVLLGAVTTSGLFPETHWVVQVAGMVLAALAAIGYTAARAKVKAAGQPLSMTLSGGETTTGKWPRQEAGFVTLRALRFLALAYLMAFVMLVISSCTAAQRTETTTALIDCGEAGVASAADQALDRVRDALDKPADFDWRTELYKISRDVGEQALACALQVVARATDGVRALATEPTASQRAGAYIAEQGWRYEPPLARQ